MEDHRPWNSERINALFDPDPQLVADAVAANLKNIGSVLSLPSELSGPGMGPSAALSLVTPYVRGAGRKLGDPGFLAHMDPPTPWVSWVAALLAASSNQNLLHPDTAPAARELETTVIGWLSRAFGMGGGHLVPGSTIANLTALWAARDITGARTVVASGDSHLSIRKAAAILGLDYRAIDHDGTAVKADKLRVMTQEHLAKLFDPERSDGLDPAATIVVPTAGTTGTGAIDQLDCSRLPVRPAWVHVDAAWAGPLQFSASHRYRLQGIARADSIAVSAHKWLHQPKESAMVLFADSARADEAISIDGDYLAVPNVGVLGSHGATAAPLAATLLTLGQHGIASLIDHGMATADVLLRLVGANERLVAFGRNSSGVVAWRHLDHDSAAIQAEMTKEQPARKAFVSTVEIDGETWLRSVAANPMAQPARVVAAVLAAGKRLNAGR